MVNPAILANQAADDVRGFAVEKYGIPPDVCVLVTETADVKAACLPPLVLYTLAEVLKNAVTALERKHGQWDLDEALPITVSLRMPDATSSAAFPSLPTQGAREDFFWLGSQGPSLQPSTSKDSSTLGEGPLCEKKSPRGFWEIEVKDYAGGMHEDALANAHRFFFSTVQASPAAGYGYSKDHGAKFAGLGVGLPMARMYAEMMGGSLAVASHEDQHGRGTRVVLQLPMEGFAFHC